MYWGRRCRYKQSKLNLTQILINDAQDDDGYNHTRFFHHIIVLKVSDMLSDII